MRLGRGTVEVLFLAIAGLAAISCLARPDYNLPLAVFLWWAFFYVPEDRKLRQQRLMIFFVMLSLVQDIIYVFYWPMKWFSAEWLALSDKTEVLHVLVLFTSIAELTLKIAVVMILVAPGIVDQTTEGIRDWLNGVPSRFEQSSAS